MMRKCYIITAILFLFSVSTAKASKWEKYQSNKDPIRLILLADMGNEPDEEQQVVHLLMYSNEFQIAGLIAVTGKFLNPSSSNIKKQKLYPELFHEIINGYSGVYDNLKLHSENYPTADYLHSIVRIGQKGYGSNAIGDGFSSPGSELIISTLVEENDDPIVVVVNAGSNTLAQALYDFKNRYSKAELASAISKLRVIENGAQDDAGAWICHNFPDIYWVRSNYQAYAYAGPSVDGGNDNKGSRNELGPHTWEPYAYSGLGQHQWALEHIISGNGPIGCYWPIRQFPKGGVSFMEGGGTIPFLCLVNKGLSDINNLHWGGWSGRYTQEKVTNYWSKHLSVKTDELRHAPFRLYGECSDSWINPEDNMNYNSIFAPVWRWRRAFMNDFKFRMDWCKLSFEHANHNPLASIDEDRSNAILLKEVKAGEEIILDATESTDCDGDKLYFSWFHYQEVGDFEEQITINNSNMSKASFIVPKGSNGKEIHIILELRDNKDYAQAMFDYRRLILKVK